MKALIFIFSSLFIYLSCHSSACIGIGSSSPVIFYPDSTISTILNNVRYNAHFDLDNNLLNTLPTPEPISGLTQVCTGQSATYSVPEVAGAIGYLWNIPSGWSGASTTNSILLTSDGSNGQLSVQAVGTCGNSEAQTLEISSLLIPPTPILSDTIVQYCPGDAFAVEVTNYVQGMTIHSSYLDSWYIIGVGGWLTGLSGGSGSGEVYVTSQNACGISDTASFVISLGTSPTPILSEDSIEYCPGDAFVVEVTNFAPGMTIHHSDLGSWNIIELSGSLIASGGGSGSGEVYVTSQNACGISDTATFVISLGPAPIAPILSDTIVEYCPSAGFNVEVTNFIPGMEIHTYYLGSWDIIQLAGYIIGTNGGSESGEVYVTNQNACGISDTATFIVNPTLLPLLNEPLIGPQLFCPGDTFQYSINSADNADYYTWSIPNGWIGSSDSTSISVITNNTIGTINVYATNACGNGNTIGLQVSPIYLISTLTLQNSAIHAIQTADSYQWFDCNDNFSMISGANQQTYSFTASGSYAVQITQDGCTIQSDCFDVTYIHIDNNSLENTLFIYPNPAQDIILFKMDKPEMIFIYNLTGQLVLTEYVQMNGGMDISALASGPYVVRNQSQNSMIFIKE